MDFLEIEVNYYDSRETYLFSADNNVFNASFFIWQLAKNVGFVVMHIHG